MTEGLTLAKILGAAVVLTVCFSASFQLKVAVPPVEKEWEIIPPPSQLSCAGGLGSLDCPHSKKEVALLNVQTYSEWTTLFENFDGNTDHKIIAGLLDEVRGYGEKAGGLNEIISNMLPHQAKIYQGRDKWQVLRLRAYAFVTLSEIGFPASAMPMLVDALLYMDERMSVIEIGAVMRVVGTLGEEGRRFIPNLLELLEENLAEEEFSLSRYEVDFPRREATTVQLEAVRSLAAIGTAKDREALKVLRSFSEHPEPFLLDPRLIEAAKNTLQMMDSRMDFAQPYKWLTVNAAPTNDRPWLNTKERQTLQNLDIALVDQEGQAHTLNRLVDRPVLLTFFYSRCQNTKKCSATISQLARLQGVLEEKRMLDKVRLLAITFEPDFDTPRRLKRYVVDRGLKLDNYAMAIKLDKERHAAFVQELDTPVAFSSGWVNTHGVEAVLLDAEGRLVRKYQSLGWNEKAVMEDFRRLLQES